jgi:hypothetical protein
MVRTALRPSYGSRGYLGGSDAAIRSVASTFGKTRHLAHSSKAGGSFTAESQPERLIADVLTLAPRVQSFRCQLFPLGDAAFPVHPAQSGNGASCLLRQRALMKTDITCPETSTQEALRGNHRDAQNADRSRPIRKEKNFEPGRPAQSGLPRAWCATAPSEPAASHANHTCTGKCQPPCKVHA